MSDPFFTCGKPFKVDSIDKTNCVKTPCLNKNEGTIHANLKLMQSLILKKNAEKLISPSTVCKESQGDTENLSQSLTKHMDFQESSSELIIWEEPLDAIKSTERQILGFVLFGVLSF